MADHKLKVLGADGAWQGVCSCLTRSPRVLIRQQVEDWWYEHRADVQRARAALSTKTPSLATTRDWYQKQADNIENSPKDRRQWKILADELTARLGDKTAGEPHPGLW